MKYIKSYKIFESRKSESHMEHIGLLQDLTTDLTDDGLYVEITTDDVRFESKIGVDYIYLKISDDDKIFYKPEEEDNWLINKDIIKDFLSRLDDLGIKRDKDYKLYGGGDSTTLVFEGKQIDSIKLESTVYGSEFVENLDIVNYISDILLEIEDEGLECRMWLNGYRDNLNQIVKHPRPVYKIEIEIDHDGIQLDAIENTISSLNKYCNSINWDLNIEYQDTHYTHYLLHKISHPPHLK